MTRAVERALFATIVWAMGCAARPVVPQPGPDAATPPEHASHQHAPSLRATPGPGFTVADVRFMQNMIGHHAQAILMSAMVPERSASDLVRRLARKIDISQRDEIEFMKQWLVERQQAVPDDAQAHAMMMPGMLGPTELAQLGAARGRTFDRLFLTFMIRHHEGALQMVQDLFRAPGAAQDPDVFRFATDVDADQRDEIFVMQRLLDEVRD